MPSTRGLLAPSLALALAACGAQPQLEPVPPLRYQAAGDTLVFGHGPVAVDPFARLMRIELRTRARVLIYAMDRQHQLSLLDWRMLDAGLHDILPYRAGRRPADFRPGYNALLIIVTDEEAGDEMPPDLPSMQLSPAYALGSVAPSVLRRPSSLWATYLITP